MATLDLFPLQYQIIAPSSDILFDPAWWEGLMKPQRTFASYPCVVAEIVEELSTSGFCSQMFYRGVGRMFGKLWCHTDHWNDRSNINLFYKNLFYFLRNKSNKVYHSILNEINSNILYRGVRHCSSLKMAMASPDTDMTEALFMTCWWNASTASMSPASSLVGMWNRISINDTGVSSF